MNQFLFKSWIKDKCVLFEALSGTGEAQVQEVDDEESEEIKKRKDIG